MLLALSLLAVLGLPPGPDPPAARASGQAAAPAFIVHHQPAIPLVSLRMAILASDPAGHAGAGHLIQHLALPTLRDQVGRVGGVVQAERSADAIVYTVTGPAAELGYLAGVLRGLLQTPAATQGELLLAKRALSEERLAEWEAADQHIRAVLRARLFPGDLSAAGTVGSAERLTLAALPGLWASLYRPERVSVVGVGDVRIEELERAFGDLPARPTAPALDAGRDTVMLRPLAPAQATRGWLAVGYPADDLDAAQISIAARLLGDDLRLRLPDTEVAAEHWWTHHGQALVLVISAPPPQIAAARRALNTAVSTLALELDDRRVDDAVEALRHDMLFYVRTPDRMAEVLGTFSDRAGDPEAAQDFYGALDRLEADEVRDALEALLDRSAERFEIAPQQLNPG